MGHELTGAPLHLARVRADLAKARAAAAASGGDGRSKMEGRVA
jgi:hypothetical protein